jgi:hypothetical protein
MTTYSPKSLPPNAGPQQLGDYVERELNEIARAFSEQDVVFMRVVYREPDKPREGWLVYADGTEWDPGSGRGVYEYRSGVWEKL